MSKEHMGEENVRAFDAYIPIYQIQLLTASTPESVTSLSERHWHSIFNPIGLGVSNVITMRPRAILVRLRDPIQEL